jgi:hypothetical protein
MQSRIIISALFLVGMLGVGTSASRGGADVNGPRNWSIVNFVNPVMVQDRVVMGPVMIVHDDAKMERGEPCTTFYAFDKDRGPREELVSFHCTPIQKSVSATMNLVLADGIDGSCKRLVSYQFAGDSEAHAVPSK